MMRKILSFFVFLYALGAYAQYFESNPRIGTSFDDISPSSKGEVAGTCNLKYTGGFVKLRLVEVVGKDLRFEAQLLTAQGVPLATPINLDYYIKETVETSTGIREIVCGSTRGSITFSKGSTSAIQTVTPVGFTSGKRRYCAVLITGNTRYYSNVVTVTAPKPMARTGEAIFGAENATVLGTFNGYGRSTNYYFQYGTSRSNLSQTTADSYGASGTGEFDAVGKLKNLSPQTTYYYRLVAHNDAGTGYGDIKSFTTAAKWVLPSIISVNATNIKATTATLVGQTNPNGSSGVCFFKYGLTTALGRMTEVQKYEATNGTLTFSFDISTLAPNTTYYYRFYSGSTNGSAVDVKESEIRTFTTLKTGNTGNNPPPGDNTPGGNTQVGTCDLTGLSSDNAYYGATAFLCERGVLNGSGVDGRVAVEDNLKRAHLAKIAFRGLYSLKGRQVPVSVPSDVYPSVYPDIATQTADNSYYYQAARALMYLEYGDGVAPFDRNRINFEPSATITRIDVLKMLCETFNIKPDVHGTNNPFPDDANAVSLLRNNPVKFGYLRRAAALGLVVTPSGGNFREFRPYATCSRGEAFTILTRIIRKIEAGELADPNPSVADYFEPLNLTTKTLALGLNMQMGNFNHYTKSSFSLDGVMPLNFAHEYNSYNTTLPEAFYGAHEVGGKPQTYQPLGVGWSHSYHSYITLVGSGSERRAVVHWGGGTIHIYASDGQRMVAESMGVYDEMQVSYSGVTIRTKDKMTYEFTNQGTSTGILYLSTITDRNGNKLTLNYTSGQNGDKVLSTVSDGQRVLTFRYKSGTNLLESVIDPIGRSINYYYTYNKVLDAYTLTSFVDAERHTTTYEYVDANSRSTAYLLKRIQLPKGNYIENNYEAYRRLKQSVAGLNGVPQTKTTVSVVADYKNSPRTTSAVSVERGGKTSNFIYNYNSNNVVTSMRGGEGLTMQASYGNSNQPVLPTSIKSNSSEVSDISYDARGNVLSVTVRSLDGDESYTSRFTYDANDNLLSTTDNKGNTTYYNYDAKGNLVAVRGPEGSAVELTLDSRGLPTRVRSAEGVEMSYAYNRYGNVSEIVQQAIGLTSTLNYDGASRLTAMTNAIGNTTRYRYNNVDLLTEETNPAGHSTRYTYDANDNLTSIINAKGGVTTMTYNNTTDWLQSVAFGGVGKSFEYNQDGSIKSLTRPDGHKLNYAYDYLGRVLNDGINSYTYDRRMNLSTVRQGDKALTYVYDGFNRVREVSYNDVATNRIQYAYDANGNVVAMTYPDGKKVQYAYDALNRLTSLTDRRNRSIRYTYNRDSKLLRIDYPNGMFTTYDYDGGGRLIAKKTTLRNGKTIAGYDFELDNLGNIVSQTATEPYTNSVEADEVEDYAYTPTNRIQRAGTLSFSFDANGNTLQRGSESYTWDAGDRLTRAGNTAIEYDPFGNIRKYGTTRYLTDLRGIGSIIAEANEQGNISHYYLHGLGLEARIAKDGDIRYYVSDVRGSIVALVDDAGEVTHRYQYDEYGKITQLKEQDSQPFRYVGAHGVVYLNDYLYYMRARHYDPTIGRFLSEDPIWSTNLYPYAENNPIMGIDPKGESMLNFGSINSNELVSSGTEKLGSYMLEYASLAGGIATSDALVDLQTKVALSQLKKEVLAGGETTTLHVVAAMPILLGMVETIQTGNSDHLVNGVKAYARNFVIKQVFKYGVKPAGKFLLTNPIGQTASLMAVAGYFTVRGFQGKLVDDGVSLVDWSMKKMFGQDIDKRLHDSKFGKWFRSKFGGK